MKDLIRKILREETIKATTRKSRSQWSPEATQDINAFHPDLFELGEAKKKKKKAKRDACYHKVKSRYKVWPSAYGSGALVKCRKVGAKNWGNSTKEETLVEKRKLTKKPSSETSLKDWFGRKGAKGSTGGWVDCNAPDGKGGYKSCGRKSGEKRSKYPACRPTPAGCKSKGKGKKWGKKSTKESVTEQFNNIKTWGEVISEAEYRGRKVKLNKPTRGDVKKFKVYVKNDKGNVVKVNFGHGGTSAKKRGEKTMRIKKSDPARRKAFRARHNCDNPGPKWKARYWSCKKW